MSAGNRRYTRDARFDTATDSNMMIKRSCSTSGWLASPCKKCSRLMLEQSVVYKALQRLRTNGAREATAERTKDAWAGKANLVSLFELTDTYSLTVCSDLDAASVIG